MRVEASEVLAVDRSRDPAEMPDVPIGVGYNRNTKIGEITQAAIGFASDFLTDFNLPSTPTFQLGNIRGFEDTHKAFVEVVGVIQVNAEVVTRNQRVIRISLAIPLYKGEFQKPSIAFYREKRHVFSQELIDKIVEDAENTKPVIDKPMTPTQSFHHEDIIERPMFGAPIDPTEWSLLLTERL
jgi:hypothetical protein